MIEIKDLDKIYNPKKSNELYALKNVNIKINSGEMTAVIGKSGAGKSTLLHIIALLDKPSGGTYFLDGTDVSRFGESKLSALRCQKIGIVLQDFGLIPDETVLHNISVPLYFGNSKLGSIRKQAMDAVNAVGISEFCSKKVSRLSGGQKQRVAIARAIVNRPNIILADEPTGALDSKTASEIMEVFRALNKSGKTVIIVTHDKTVAEKCDRIIELSDGEIVSDKLFRD